MRNKQHPARVVKQMMGLTPLATGKFRDLYTTLTLLENLVPVGRVSPYSNPNPVNRVLEMLHESGITGIPHTTIEILLSGAREDFKIQQSKSLRGSLVKLDRMRDQLSCQLLEVA